MNRQTLVAVIIGLMVVTAGVGFILYGTRNNRVALEGELLKVRTHQTDPGHTAVIVDFRIRNSTNNQFVVRDVKAFLIPPTGEPVEGMVAAENDARRLFQYYKDLGQKYNLTLVIRERINSGGQLDRMVAISFPVTEQAIANRKGIRITIEDVDGASTEKKGGSRGHCPALLLMRWPTSGTIQDNSRYCVSEN